MALHLGNNLLGGGDLRGGGRELIRVLWPKHTRQASQGDSQKYDCAPEKEHEGMITLETSILGQLLEGPGYVLLSGHG